MTLKINYICNAVLFIKMAYDRFLRVNASSLFACHFLKITKNNYV